MPERILLSRGKNGMEFAGSVDENGCVYDRNHQLLGRIAGNKVYDNCNIERATINANGEIWDINHNYVGTECGENFLDPMQQFRGSEMGATYGHNQGRDYGAIQVLTNFEDATLYNPPVEACNCLGESDNDTPEGNSFDDDYKDGDLGCSYDDPPTAPRKPATRDYECDGTPSESYVDVSKMGAFRGCVMSFFAGLMGKEIVASLGRRNRFRG